MKDKIRNILNNPTNKLIAIDLDGTLCVGEFWGVGDEPEPKPIQPMIDFMNSLYMKGGHIIIYTARRPELCRDTIAWLIKYSVMYHGIAFQQKPGADLYIDDKSINVEDL